MFNATNSPVLTLLFALTGAVCWACSTAAGGAAKMPAFIVTLSTMMIYRSIALYYLRAVVRQSIYKLDATLDTYKDFYGFGQYKVLT